VIDLDHVALAAPDVQPIVDLLVGELGGTALFGKEPPDFRWVLVRVGDGEAGMNLELLEPTGDESSFLQRFLARRGPGPHHLTFKTDDLERLIGRVREGGRELVDVSLDDPEWREAFLRPRDAHGTIVQLASSTLERPPMAELLALPPEALTRYARGAGPSRVWWREPPRGGETLRLECVVLRTPALDDALRLYRDLLGGELVGESELHWPGGRLRLERGDDAGIVALEVRGPARADLSLAGLPLRIVGP
jgi:catechol 2,3-dioxygenase-like lactoylglutathione lyase family enzyme